MDVTCAAQPVRGCRVCGGSDWQDVVSFGPMPLANSFPEPASSYSDEPRYPLGVMSCRRCRLMSLTHVVDPELLFRNYLYVMSQSPTMWQHMRQVTRQCRLRLRLPANSLVVEVGSNTGAHLGIFRAAGMRTLGVDPARNLAEVARRNGIDTLAEFFDVPVARSIRRTHGRARVIMGRHVFAHIDDLAEVLAAVRELLARDGVLVVEVPHLLDLVENVAFDTIYHEHLSYFTVGALARLFDRHGLRLFDAERVRVHGGSILAFAGRAEGPWRTRESVRRLMAVEERAGLYSDSVYRSFAANVAGITEELPALVRHLVATGNTVAGYGAPAKGNTILNVCGLGPAEVSFCSDTTSLKQGKVLPGVHIPVRTPRYAKAHAPDYYLLLAWNHAGDILRAEHAFLDGGGKFIQPIPWPSVISADGRRVVASSVTRG
jgi:SAM-dependent methyltransferase